MTAGAKRGFCAGCLCVWDARKECTDNAVPQVAQSSILLFRCPKIRNSMCTL